MRRTNRRRVTVTLIESPGAEMWYVVKHDSGSFRVPSWAAIETVMVGACERWSSAPRVVKSSERSFAVPLGEYVEFDAWRRSRRP